MKKLILFILFYCSLLKAQTTVTTATPLFPDGNNFAGGTVQAVFTPPTGIIDQNLYLLNGSPFPYIVSGTINGSGQFSLTLTDDHIVRPLGGRWMFTVCSPASVPCTTSLQDVFGASIDLSSLITIDVKPIFAPPSYFPIYFEDSEIDNNINGGTEYFNFLSKTFRCWNGSAWSNCGGGGGGGGVSSFTAGNLVPVFTTTVTNPSTTPILNFFLTNAPAHTVLANETGSTAPPSYQADSVTVNTTSPLTGGALVHLGGSITLACPTCSVPQVSVTATSPIVVTPSPGVSTFVISCPTCGTNTGTLSNFSAGNLSPLFTTSVSNPTTTPNLTFALSNAAANTILSNFTGGSATPLYNVVSDCGDSTHALKYTGGTGFGCQALSSTQNHGLVLRIGSTTGAALTVASTTTEYFNVPFACTIAGYSLGLLPSGTVTVKFWKIATGTAMPTSANSINTSGVGISSGTAVTSSTLSDFTTLSIAKNDWIAMNITAVATASYVTGTLECNQ